MTSLIDVIFLLLLFFMLSSTFTRFAEIDLAASGSGGGAGADRPVFLSLAASGLRVNGRAAEMASLPAALAALRSGEARLGVLVAVERDVTSQRMADLLVSLRRVPTVQVTVLEAS